MFCVELRLEHVFSLFKCLCCVGQINLQVFGFFLNFDDRLLEMLFRSVQLPEVGETLADDFVQALLVVRRECGQVDNSDC